MSTVTEEIKVEREPSNLDIPPPPPPEGGDGGNGGDGPAGDPASTFPVSKGRLGLWLLLTGVTMLFAGLSSAYLVLRGVPSWQNVAVPSVLWLNTFVLLASSVTMEGTRRRIREGRLDATRTWITWTAILGFVFLAGQLVAWRQLVAAGVYLPSTLHSSFLYVLTGTHALHLIGGMGGLVYVWREALKNRYTRSSHEPISLCATYWHFMDGLWVYLLLLLILA
jgi:cytochrome c oxidase subunit 3